MVGLSFPLTHVHNRNANPLRSEFSTKDNRTERPLCNATEYDSRINLRSSGKENYPLMRLTLKLLESILLDQCGYSGGGSWVRFPR